MSDPFANAHSVETERAVIHVLLDGRHKEAPGLLQESCPTLEYFWLRDHQMIIAAVFNLIAESVIVGRLSIETELQRISFEDFSKMRINKSNEKLDSREGIDIADSLAAIVKPSVLNEISAEAFGSYSGFQANLQIIVEYHAQRELIRLTDALAFDAKKPAGSRRIASLADQAITQLAKISTGPDAVGNVSDAILSSIRRHQALQTLGNAKAGSWGLEGLDRVIPLRPGRFIVLAAQPNHGKTSLGIQAATASADLLGNGAVGVISLEMPAEELGTVFAARQLGIPTRRIESGLLPPDQLDAMKALAARWVEKDIFLRSSSGRCTVDDVCSWIRQRFIRSGGKLTLVILDYLQLLDSRGRQSPFEMLSEATRALKRLAIDLRICLLVLSQMNREGTKADRDSSGKVRDNPEPRLADLRGSGTIEQDADGVVFIYPPKESHSPDLPVMLRVAKNRGGPKPEPIDAIFRRGNGQTFEQVLSMARVVDPLPEDTSRAHHNHEPRPSEDLYHAFGEIPEGR